MKTKAICVGLILLTISFNKCSFENKNISTESQSPGNTTINIDPGSEKVNISNYFRDYEVYKIKDILLGEIYKVFELEDELLVFANGEDCNVFLFNKENGNIKKIAKKGKGPENFLSIKDISVYNNEFAILDYKKRKITQFLLNGEFSNSINLPSPFQGLSSIGRNYLALYKDVPQVSEKPGEFRLNIFNKNKMSIENKFFPIDPELSWERASTKGFRFYHYFDTLCLFQTSIDTIYNIYEDRITPRYLLNYRKYKMPDEIFFNNKLKLNEFLQYCKQSDYIWGINYFFESKKYLFFTYIYDNQLFFNFFDKYNSKSVSSYIIRDDIFFKIDFQATDNYLGIHPVGGNEESLFFVIDPYYILKHTEKLREDLGEDKWVDFKSKNTYLIEIISNLSINDNQLILKYIY